VSFVFALKVMSNEDDDVGVVVFAGMMFEVMISSLLMMFTRFFFRGRVKLKRRK
jgi:hypothetical protein